jgi:oxygen-dependent protoporphyrinogen oxidase
MPRVVIVGGGISGLSTAYYLARSGCGSTVIESRGRLGGVIQTERVDGCIIEAGPDSFLSAKPAALELIRDLGLADQVIGSNDHLRITYVRKGGRLVPLPDGLMMMVPTKILPLLTTRLFSFQTKMRMGLELLRRAMPSAGEQSVADFVEEHYGAEAVDYLAEPLLSGIYGGDPAELSATSVLPRFVELAAKYGSLTRGVLAERVKAAHARKGAVPMPLFRTLKGGLGQMVDRAAAVIQGNTEVLAGRAETVERRTERRFWARWTRGWRNCWARWLTALR